MQATKWDATWDAPWHPPAWKSAEARLADMRAGRDCECHDNHYCGCFEREKALEEEVEAHDANR